MHTLHSIINIGLLLLANSFVNAAPQFLPRAAGCTQDSLYQCLESAPSLASSYCLSLPATTQTIITATSTSFVTVTAYQTAAESTASVVFLVTATDYTATVPIATVTQTSYSGQPQPTGLNCLTSGTTYALPAVTSACSCIGAPPRTVTSIVTFPYIIQTSTITFYSTGTFVSTVTAISTTTIQAALSATVTTTVVLPEPTNIVVNGDFETGNLSPWSVLQNNPSGGVLVSITTPPTGDSSSYALELQSSYYNDGANTDAQVGQTLGTVPGATYAISFQMLGIGGGSNYWQVAVGGTVIASGTTGGDESWNEYSGTFVGTGSDVVAITASSQIWGIGTWYYDNFAVVQAL